MIIIMTEKEYEMAGMRRVLEESALVFVHNSKGTYDLRKNRFGNAAKDLSLVKMSDLIKIYFKFTLDK